MVRTLGSQAERRRAGVVVPRRHRAAARPGRRSKSSTSLVGLRPTSAVPQARISSPALREVRSSRRLSSSSARLGGRHASPTPRGNGRCGLVCRHSSHIQLQEVPDDRCWNCSVSSLHRAPRSGSPTSSAAFRSGRTIRRSSSLRFRTTSDGHECAAPFRGHRDELQVVRVLLLILSTMKFVNTNESSGGERFASVSSTAARTLPTRAHTPSGSGLTPSTSSSWKITFAMLWLSISRAPLNRATSVPIVYLPTPGRPMKW